MMKSIVLVSVIFASLFQAITCPPVVKKPKKTDFAEEENAEKPYMHYINQISQELREDKTFIAKILNSSDLDELTVEDALSQVNHHIRNRLDELKRKEILRLNQLEKELEASNQGRGIHRDFVESLSRDHLYEGNPDRFEAGDLVNVIKKVRHHMKDIDEKMEEHYKRYEMKKRRMREEKLKHAKTEKERKEIMKEFEESKKRHRQHEKVHSPGSREQIREVVRDEQHLDPRDVDTVTIFKMFDLNNDGHWDELEMDALLQHELKKVYNETNPDDDANERYHEMMRMRKEFEKRADTNDDGMISLKEYDDWLKSYRADLDPDWKTDEEDDDDPFSEEEYNEFVKQYESSHQDENLKSTERGPTMKTTMSTTPIITSATT